MGADLSKSLALDPNLRRSAEETANSDARLAFCQSWHLHDVNAAIHAYVRKREIGVHALLPTSDPTSTRVSLASLQSTVDLQSATRLLYQQEWTSEVARLQRCFETGNTFDAFDVFDDARGGNDEVEIALLPQSLSKVKLASDSDLAIVHSVLTHLVTQVERCTMTTFQAWIDASPICQELTGDLEALEQASADSSTALAHASSPRTTLNLHAGNFQLELMWQPYFVTIKEIDRRSRLQSTKRSYHPVATGYAMTVDKSAAKAWTKYLFAQLNATKVEHGPEEGHTDDEVSDSDPDEDEVFLAETPADVPSMIMERMDEGGFSGEGVPELNKRSTIARPAAFDPKCRSPIFFGYTTTLEVTYESILATEHATETATIAREDEIWQRHIKTAPPFVLSEELEFCKRKYDAIQSKREELVASAEEKLRFRTARHHDELAMINKNVDSTDPNTESMDTEMKEELENYFKWESEKLHSERLLEEERMVASLAKFQARMDASTSDEVWRMKRLRRLMPPDDQPLKQTRTRYHTENIALLTTRVSELNVELNLSYEAYEAYVSDSVKENSHAKRSQVLYLQNQIMSCEAARDKVNGYLKDELFMRERSLAIEADEDKYRPLYEALTVASQAEFKTLSLVDLIIALSCGATNVSLDDKLTFLFESFCDTSHTMNLSTLATLLTGVLRTLVAFNTLPSPERKQPRSSNSRR